MKVNRFPISGRISLKPLSILAATFAIWLPRVALADSLDFLQYPVESVYRGEAATPDFINRDKSFSTFRTRILKGMKAGPAFAGEYAIIQIGCGTGCSSVLVANERTGELSDFPRGGEQNQGLELQFDVKSSLMLARWYTDSIWDHCVFESFVFDKGVWAAKTSVATGVGDSKDACDGNVADGFRKKLR